MMKNKLLQNIYLIGLSLFYLCFSSCYSTYNVTSPQHNLHIDEAQDLKCSGSLSMNVNVLGAHGQLGYSPIKHLAISASGTLTTSEGVYKEKAYEVALGGYLFKEKTPASSMDKNGVLFDLYAGYGQGNMRRETRSGKGFAEISCHKYFVQPGICFQKDSYLLSTSLRAGILDYEKALLSGTASGYYESLYEVLVNEPYIYGDFMFKAEADFRKLRFFAATHFKYIPEATFEYGNSQVYVGVIFDINDLFKGSDCVK